MLRTNERAQEEEQLRSSSSSLKLNAEINEIAKLFECPVCYETITPPVVLCFGGHAVCNFCRENLKSCPACRLSFTGIRNRFAEDFLDRCLIYCKYRDSGCVASLPGRELSEHYKKCDYRPLFCQTCEQDIPYSKYLDHLRNEEKLETQMATECSTGFEIEDEELFRSEAERFSVWEPTWIHAYNRDFFCFLETVKSHWWIWVGLFGTAEDCKDFVCSITVWNKERKTELKYVGKIHPLRTPREEVLESGNCLIFLDVNLKNYMYKGGIDVLVRIDKEYVAPRTRKGSVVESPVTIFGKKSFTGSGGEHGSRSNRLSKFSRNSPHNPNGTDNENEVTANISDAGSGGSSLGNTLVDVDGIADSIATILPPPSGYES